jgi:hypothetical protein
MFMSVIQHSDIVKHLRKIGPKQVLVPLVTADTCTESVTSYWVTSLLLSLSSYYNGFNTCQDEQIR